MTVISLFEDRVMKDGNVVCFNITRDGKKITWTFDEYFRACKYFASAMIELGIKERGCINVIGYNSPEWIVGYIGM